MSCRVCTVCGVNYPPTSGFMSCRICGELTRFSAMLAQSNWEQVVQANKALDEAEEEAGRSRAKTKEPKKRSPFIPNATGAKITEVKGQLFVGHKSLIDAGYAEVRNFDVVLINGKYYELQGHVGKRSTEIPGGVWWIEEIDPSRSDA